MLEYKSGSGQNTWKKVSIDTRYYIDTRAVDIKLFSKCILCSLCTYCFMIIVWLSNIFRFLLLFWNLNLVVLNRKNISYLGFHLINSWSYCNLEKKNV